MPSISGLRIRGRQISINLSLAWSTEQVLGKSNRKESHAIMPLVVEEGPIPNPIVGFQEAFPHTGLSYAALIQGESLGVYSYLNVI